VHAVSALERGERRRPHVETVRALSAALDLNGSDRDALLVSARTSGRVPAEDRHGTALPLAATLLLGRDADVQTLRRWLADATIRLVTLTGPGGAGKTRLAVEVARGVAAERAPRVLFVPLAAARSPAFVASAVAEAFGLWDVAAADLPARARVACEDCPTLLVLDNFEHVIEAAQLVADLLSAIAPLQVLITSRAPLRIRGEREYAVGPLTLDADADSKPLPDVARAPAVRMFVDRVRDIQPDFRLTPANAPTVTAICRRLDALPLALELAAPWMKVLSPEKLLAGLGDDLLLSTVGPRDLPERQQTMNATVAWSYELLAPDEQRAFRRFGALPFRFPIEAAAAVLGGRGGTPHGTGHALSAAAALIDKSLLLQVGSTLAGRPLYQMLETVRAYAALELAGSGEYEDAMDGLVRYCAEEASLAARGLVGPAQLEWLDRVRSDFESYRSALTWLIERGRYSEASSIAAGVMFYWLICGYAAEGLQWYDQIIGMTSTSPDAESKVRAGAALMSYSRGDVSRARRELARALDLAAGAPGIDPYVIAQAENLAGYIEYAAGDLAAARDRFLRALEPFRAVSASWGAGSALLGLAQIALASGETGQADRLLDEATSVLRLAGPWFRNPVLFVRAILAVRRRNADEAIALMRENLSLIQQLHDKFAFVYALVPLAAAAAIKGEHAWAARILGVRDAVMERTGVTVVDTPVHDIRELAEREARGRLGEDRWMRAYNAGRKTAIDSAQALYHFVAEAPR
jgi:predicted ATPase